MNIDLNNIDFKKIMKEEEIKASDFAYDWEYQQGFYFPLSSDYMQFEIAFGKKSKTKKVAYLKINHPNFNFLLQEAGIDIKIGERPMGYIEKTINSVYLRLDLDDHGYIKSIYAENTDVIDENNQDLIVNQKLSKVTEAEGSHIIHELLSGYWILSEEETTKHNFLKKKSIKALSKKIKEYIWDIEIWFPSIYFMKDLRLTTFNTDFSKYDDEKRPYKISRINKNGTFTITSICYGDKINGSSGMSVG